MAEGSIWEALDKASHYKLSNLIAIVDVNRLGQRGPTELSWDLEAYRRRSRRSAPARSSSTATTPGDRPGPGARPATATRPPDGHPRPDRQGQGFSEVEDREGWHGKPFPAEMAERAIVELGGERNLIVRGPKPDGRRRPRASAERGSQLPTYAVGDKVATRKAYGRRAGGNRRAPRIVAMDGEVSNSTFADEFAQKYPERYFEMYIAEQQLVAAAVGSGARLPPVRFDVRGLPHARI